MSKTAQGAVELTPRQSRFVDEYLQDANATQAYQRAGYKAKGRAAENNASRLLGHAGVQQAIRERMNQRSERTQIDADYVLHRLAEIDQMDVLDIMSDDGTLLSIREWPKVWRQFISGMDVTELFEGAGEDRKQIGLLKKIKWPDKVKNLELLGKHVDVQAWRERHEHTGKDGGPMQLQAEVSAPEIAAAVQEMMKHL